MDVSVHSFEEGGRTVVQVGGEIDVYTAPVLRERLAALHESGQHDLVVDLRAVRFMDSTGLGVLVGVLKRVRLAGGSLSLVIDSERILKVFRITALTQIFDIFDSVGDALAGTPSEPEAASPAES
jgi:anti-sigma B factor antagonist